MNFLNRKTVSKQKYEHVSVEEVNPFSIDETDEVELSMDQLAQMHNDLLYQARTAISSTEDSVKGLREERQQSEHQLRALTGTADGSVNGSTRRPCGCCYCGSGRCVIL
mmetsp:Transcript_28985/g.58403  ORF Transcript_28985/g.58403 Transcript_28985/m.58403 type:complete len:109 (-) Transcript_28985:480-806(-)